MLAHDVGDLGDLAVGRHQHDDVGTGVEEPAHRERPRPGGLVGHDRERLVRLLQLDHCGRLVR